MTMYTATVSDAVVTISKVDTDGTSSGCSCCGRCDSVVHAGITAATLEATTENLPILRTQYNEMRNQITELAEDSGYKGKNLLSATAALRALTVQFEGTTLTVVRL